MNNLVDIIKEEIINKFLQEYDEDELYSWEDDVKRGMFNNFLYKNNEDFSKHTPWKLIPFPRLKKIWEDYINTGVIRDNKGLEMIESIVISNIIKINYFTYLLGHTPHDPEEDFEDNIGYYVDEQLNCILPGKKEDRSQLEIPFDNPQSGYKQKIPSKEPEPCNTVVNPYIKIFMQENYEPGMSREKMKELIYNELKDKFFEYFSEDPKSGQAYISDFALQPLLKLMNELINAYDEREKLTVIDKILNVVHQRSDIASWFVEGGSHALDTLSGYLKPEDKDDPYSGEVSSISGKYNMGDYY